MTTASFDDVPVNQFLGFELTAGEAGQSAVTMRPIAQHGQEYQVVHGGIIATLADTAAVYTIRPQLGASERMTSIEFKINFLAAASVDGGEVVARAKLVRRGKRIAVAQVDVEQAGKQIATGLFTYIIF